MTGKFRRVGAGAALLGSLVLAGCGSTPSTGTGQPPVPPVYCPFGLRESEVRACGSVQVPADYAYPQGRQQVLKYAVLAGTSAQRSAGATVVLQGGPGAGVGSQARMLNDLLTRYGRPAQDVVFFDSRGVGESGPSTNCLVMPFLSVVAPDVFAQQVQDCQARLLGDGLTFADFNTRNNARDVLALADALGYERLNLYGISYGTRTAQEVVKMHPERVRSMVLDGVIDPAQATPLVQARAFQQTLGAFGQACFAAGACDVADLPGQVQQTADALDTLGLTFTLAGYASPVPDQPPLLPLSGDVLMAAISPAAYSPFEMWSLPRRLEAVRARDVGTLSELPYQAMSEGRGISAGVYASVMCQDVSFTAADVGAAQAGLLPIFQRRAGVAATLNLCSLLGLTPPADAMQPISARVPTLLLSGRFDAVTPPALAEAVKPRFTPSQHVIFEGGGHVNGLDSLCGAQMVLGFLNDPAQPLNAACAAIPFNFKP